MNDGVDLLVFIWNNVSLWIGVFWMKFKVSRKCVGHTQILDEDCFKKLFTDFAPFIYADNAPSVMALFERFSSIYYIREILSNSLSI